MSVNYNILNKIYDKTSSPSPSVVYSITRSLKTGFRDYTTYVCLIKDKNIDKYNIKKILTFYYEGTEMYEEMFARYWAVEKYRDIFKKYIKKFEDDSENFKKYKNGLDCDKNRVKIFHYSYKDILSIEDQEKFCEEIYERIDLDDFIKTLVEKEYAELDGIFEGSYTLKEIKMNEVYLDCQIFE